MANKSTGGSDPTDRDDIGTGNRGDVGDIGRGTGNVGGGMGRPGELDRERGLDRDLEEDEVKEGDQGGQGGRGRGGEVR